MVEERLLPEERAHLNREGVGLGDHLFATSVQTGVTTLLVGVCLWIAHGLSAPVTPAGLTGTLLCAVAVPSTCLALSLSRTRSRAAAFFAMAAFVAAALAAMAFTSLSPSAMGQVPAPAVCLLGVALFWPAARAVSTSKEHP